MESMESLVSSPTEMLPLLAEVSCLLHDEQRPLSSRLNEFFALLHTKIRYRDGRLVCWLQSVRPGSQQEQFYSPETSPYPWDNRLTRQTALGRQIVRQPISIQRGDTLPQNNHEIPLHLAAPTVYLGVPVVWGEMLWGVLELRASDDDHLQALEQECIAAFLPHLACVIVAEGERQQQMAGQNIQTFSHFLPEQRNDALTPRRTSLLTALEHELEEPLSLHKLLTLLLRWSLDATGAEAGAICQVDHEHGELVVQVYEGYTSESIPSVLNRHQRRRWESGLVGQVAQKGRALLVRDVTKERGIVPIESNLRAELAVPISKDGEVLAVLVLDSPRSAAFGETELAFVSMLCERATMPLHRAMVYQETLETSTHLSQVFNNLPTGLALLDISGRVLRANPAWSLLWGTPDGNNETPFHVSLDLVEVLLPRLQEPMRLVDFCADGQHAPDDTHMITLHLSEPSQEIQVLSVPTRDSLGQRTGQLWMVNDVTRERELDRLKSEFVSVVSHELRTPLTSILGFTELLLARSFSPADQRHFIQTVYDQANQLSQLVDDLLSASRMDSGRVKLNCWIVELRQIIAQLTNQLGQLEHHRLLIRMTDPLPPVYVDRDKIKQVLFNLLTNAIKYSPDGGEIELSVQPVGDDVWLPDDHPDGEWLLVNVQDQGIGIAPSDQPRIWERFYRVDNTNTRRIGGTGLGLGIARSLVELHGGRIWMESEPGQGSTFFFTLPVASDTMSYGNHGQG